MKPFLIVYATREGQTLRVAEHIAATLLGHGAQARAMDAASAAQVPDLSAFGVVILAASVHMHRHESEMVEFVKANKTALLEMPTVFLSISLSQAAAENDANDVEHRARAHAEVEETFGFMKPNESFRFGHPRAFGAPGAGGAMGYADPELRLGYGYVTSRMGMHLQGDPRDIALRAAIPCRATQGRQLIVSP